MNLQDLADNYGRRVECWPDHAQRDGVAELFTTDCDWLCDALDQFSPAQFDRMLAGLREPNPSARLTMLGDVLDELLTAEFLLDELQRRVDLHWSGWRRDREDARGDWEYHDRLEARA